MSKLLSINNYYYERGGAENVFLEHNRLFEKAGWGVIPFAMQHPSNKATPWSKYFVEEIEFGSDYSLFEKVSKASKTIYSFEARNKLQAILDAEQPTVAHGHNIYHHISPSILGKLKSNGVPTFLTLHDLKIACPAYKMLNQTGVCEQCKGGSLANVVRNKCMKDSFALSSIAWLEARLHQALGSYKNCVDRFVVPSNFYVEKFIEWGWPRELFSYVPNFVDCSEFQPDYSAGDYFVFFGRLAEEKGVETLIRAAASANVNLRLVGTGPLEQSLKEFAQRENATVEFDGYQTGVSLHQLVRGSRAVVLPSEWYENAPLSAMEAYALGKPVLGADIGGIPELIQAGVTGDIFRSGDVQQLADLLAAYQSMSDDKVESLGRAGREWMEAEFSAEMYVDRICELYASFGVRAA